MWMRALAPPARHTRQGQVPGRVLAFLTAEKNNVLFVPLFSHLWKLLTYIHQKEAARIT